MSEVGASGFHAVCADRVRVVVDFKTDVDLDQSRAEYEAQVALYARAVATATGEGARAVLLSV